MKQVLQDLKSGEVRVHDVPEPGPEPGFALVAVERSLISAGTERASASLGAKSLVEKARARPDLVRKTIEVARAEGVAAAATKVRSRLDQHAVFGYSLAGTVLDTGGDPRLVVGARVACIGAGHATHAEVVSVPSNLVIPMPAEVSADEAAFSAPAAIALHAIRLAEVGAGATVLVIGLGLIGQLAGRLLRASGCIAVGTDPRADRVVRFGEGADAAGIAAAVAAASRGRGADAVLICAATSSSEPVTLAAELARDRARVVVVGDVGLELDRRVLYDKELSLVVARSYGPGRHERAYEERGLDFPAGYVRWTEGRNVEAVLDLLAQGSLAVADLVTHRHPVGDAELAYAALNEDAGALGILLEYPEPAVERARSLRSGPVLAQGPLRVGLIGAGAFARGTLVPALRAQEGVALAAVCARSGASAASLAGRLEIPVASTDAHALATADDIDAIVISTPHSSHAALAADALEHGKAVWVEKPLSIDQDGLARVASAAEGRVLLVGHNRRFAPLAQQLVAAAFAGPRLITIRVAAGLLEPGHWLDDPNEGGRVLGEISHFVDLAAFLAGAPPTSVAATLIPLAGGGESLAALLRFADGSGATIGYGTGASPGLPKERVEVLAGDGAGVLDDFRRLELHTGKSRTLKSRRDKGHRAAVAAFVAAARGDADLPVSLDEQLLIAAASLALLESARRGRSVDVRLP